MPNRKYFILPTALLVIGLFVILVSLISSKTSQQNPQKIHGQTVQSPNVKGSSADHENQIITQTTNVKVKRIVDGDTIEIEGGQKVRYIGIDTPEIVDPRKAPQCFGQEASNKNRELVEGKEIRLEKDVSETDKYGRLLRYIYIDDLFVNDYLVRQGFANATSYPPDVKYQNQFNQAEQEARENSRGLWSQDACKNTAQSSQPSKSSEPSGSCNIKGNISSSGEKIYHMPGQYYYNKTVIDEPKGERWFCTEEEALAAGWRKSKK